MQTPFLSHAPLPTADYQQYRTRLHPLSNTIEYPLLLGFSVSVPTFVGEIYYSIHLIRFRYMGLKRFVFLCVCMLTLTTVSFGQDQELSEMERMLIEECLFDGDLKSLPGFKIEVEGYVVGNRDAVLYVYGADAVVDICIIHLPTGSVYTERIECTDGVQTPIASFFDKGEYSISIRYRRNKWNGTFVID